MSNLLCDLFYYTSSYNFTEEMFGSMWNYDRNQFIVIAFFLRQHRVIKQGQFIITGRGERKIFYQIIRWMSHNRFPELIKLLPYIPDYGYWKDILMLMNTPAESEVIKMYSEQLIKDYTSFNQPIPGLISMAAKWTPNEGSSLDKKYNVNGKIAQFIGISRKILRVQYLVPLRKYLSVPEQIISEKKWDRINYNLVPKLSIKRHTKTFQTNDSSRFEKYINYTHIDYFKRMNLPTTVRTMLENNSINEFKMMVPSKNVMIALDISGAMIGFPTILGICLCAESGAQTWIPYSFDAKNTDNPFYITTAGNNFCERTESINEIYNNSSLIREDNKIIGYNMETCMKVAHELGIHHLIIISNILLDSSEIVSHQRPFYITYWAPNLNPVNIIDYINYSIIEGYHINIYSQLCNGIILTREGYKNTILSEIHDQMKFLDTL